MPNAVDAWPTAGPRQKLAGLKTRVVDLTRFLPIRGPDKADANRSERAILLFPSPMLAGAMLAEVGVELGGSTAKLNNSEAKSGRPEQDHMRIINLPYISSSWPHSPHHTAHQSLLGSSRSPPREDLVETVAKA